MPDPIITVEKINTALTLGGNVKNSGDQGVVVEEKQSNLSEFIWAPDQLIKKLIAEVPNVIETITRWVAINTVGDPERKKEGAPYGPNLRSLLETVIKDANAMGFKRTYIDPDGYFAFVDLLGPNETLDTKKEKVVVIAVHLDTMPAGKLGEWTETDGDPFKVTVKNDKVYGLGVADDKGPAAIVLHTLAQFKDIPLLKDTQIRIVFFTNEETGPWEDVDKYIKEFGMPDTVLVPDGYFPGFVEMDMTMLVATGQGKPLPRHMIGDIEVKSISTGKNRVNQVPPEVEAVFTADSKSKLKGLKGKMTKNLAKLPSLKKGNGKGPVTFGEIESRDGKYVMKVTVKGSPSHSCEAWNGDNAIQRLAFLTRGIGLVDTPPARALYLIRSVNGFGYGWSGEGLGIITGGDPKTTGIQTLNLNVMRADENGVKMEFDSRIRLDQEMSLVEGKILQFVKDFGFEGKVEFSLPKVAPPIGSPEVQMLVAAVSNNLGKIVELGIIGGGTYARAFKDARIPMAFGILSPDHPITEHQPNEYLTLNTIKLGLGVYTDVLWNLGVDYKKVQEIGIKKLFPKIVDIVDRVERVKVKGRKFERK